MHRTLVNTPVTLLVTFDVDGVPMDPSPNTATVTITRADGTVIVAGQAATPSDNDGEFSYDIDAATNAVLDTLTASWTSSLGTVSTVTEVVGGFLFTVAEFRAYLTANKVNQASYSTAQIVEIRTVVEDTIERACGVAFVRRYRRHTFNGAGQDRLAFDRYPVRTIRALTADDATVDVEDLTVFPSGVSYGTGFDDDLSNVTVGFEYGEDHPPARIARAAMILAKNWLLAGPVDDRTTSMSTEDGTFTLATPGLRGSVTGIPEVDAAIDQYRRPRRSFMAVPLA